jgi:hypothetical protein
MKTMTGVLVLSALIVPAGPAAAQGNLTYQIERIADYALTIAADALGDLVDERRDDREARQRGPNGIRGDRGDRGPEFTETFTRTVRLGRNGRLELENTSGDIEVTGGSGDEVKITATKRVHAPNDSAARSTLSATEIQVSERAGIVAISAGPTRGRFNSVEIDYVISMPAGTNLSTRTLSGDLLIRNITGDAQLNSLSGDVIVRESTPRMLEIDVVSGDVSLEKVDSDRIDVKTVSGDITLTGRLAKNGRYELHTHSGDVQVIPEGSPGFELEARTFSGDVSSDFAVKLRGALPNNFNPGGRGSPRNNDVRGTFNDGGAVLSLHSFSGDILITKR